jgi:hypothetical protein
MVGLGTADSDKDVCSLRQRVSSQKFQFPRFVAAGRQTRLIIPLDQQSRPPTQLLPQTGHLLNGSGQMGKRHAGKMVGQHIPSCLSSMGLDAPLPHIRVSTQRRQILSRLVFSRYPGSRIARLQAVLGKAL